MNRPAQAVVIKISTHTSRVGCDQYNSAKGMLVDISTHTSRVGCDNNQPVHIFHSEEFLLTHPVWDVTCFCIEFVKNHIKFLLTHPVWDVTFFYQYHFVYGDISTHTSRVGCDD